MNNELISDLIKLIPICFTFWLAWNQTIKTWERVQEKQNAERIEAIVKAKLYEELDNLKGLFTMFKDGTFK